MMGEMLESVKRVLLIQEQRQGDYKRLRKAHDEYTSKILAVADYQSAMAEITASFQTLSQEMIALTKVLRDHSLPLAADVVEQIQGKEREKLQLTAEWQVLTAEGGEEDDGGEFEEIIYRVKTLRQKLATVEGVIAELVQDFRYECEHVLVCQQ